MKSYRELSIRETMRRAIQCPSGLVAAGVPGLLLCFLVQLRSKLPTKLRAYGERQSPLAEITEILLQAVPSEFEFGLAMAKVAALGRKALPSLCEPLFGPLDSSDNLARRSSALSPAARTSSRSRPHPASACSISGTAPKVRLSRSS